MDLNEISAFINIVQAGGLSRAAEHTGLPKSTLSRKLQQLEERLGVTLLQRTTRKITLTPAGQEYYQTCSRILTELSEAEKTVLSEQKSPQGILRFTAPAEAGWTLLAPIIREFKEKYPDIALDMDFTDRTVDMVGEGFDVALRAGLQKDSSLKVKKIKPHRFVLVASSLYLKKQGRPKTAKDLLEHNLIGFSPGREPIVWKLSTPNGKIEIPVEACVRSNSLACAQRLAQEHMGIALVPRFLCMETLVAGGLEIVLPDCYLERSEFGLVYPAGRFLPPKTRVFVDFFAEKLKSITW